MFALRFPKVTEGLSRPFKVFLASIVSMTLAACATQPLPQSPVISTPTKSRTTNQAPATASTPMSADPRTLPSIANAKAASIDSVTPNPLAGQAILATPVPAFDRVAALQTWVDQQARLYRVAAPLLIKNTELCARHSRNLLGLTAKTKYSYSDSFVEAAHAGLGLDERLRVMNVLPESGAALAGVLKGDILLAAGIDPLPPGPDAESVGAALMAEEMRGHPDLTLTLLRGDERKTIQIPLTPACAMAIDLGNTDNVNSYADGNRIMVTRGMLGFVQSDEELAYVLAREMAHNELNPSARSDMAAIIDRLHTLSAPSPTADSDAAIVPFTPVLDATVDKLALYLLARAGYDIGNVPTFWKRLAAAYPVSVLNSHTAIHPSTAYRLSVIGQIIQTIDLKRKNDLALIP